MQTKVHPLHWVSSWVQSAIALVLVQKGMKTELSLQGFIIRNYMSMHSRLEWKAMKICSYGVCHCVQLSKVHAHTVCSPHSEISCIRPEKQFSIIQPLLDFACRQAIFTLLQLTSSANCWNSGCSLFISGLNGWPAISWVSFRESSKTNMSLSLYHDLV